MILIQQLFCPQYICESSNKKREKCFKRCGSLKTRKREQPTEMRQAAQLMISSLVEETFPSQ